MPYISLKKPSSLVRENRSLFVTYIIAKINGTGKENHIDFSWPYIARFEWRLRQLAGLHLRRQIRLPK